MHESPKFPRIFVSYSRHDGYEFARRLRQQLEKAGFTLWQDLIALRGGRDWWAQIERALKASSVEHLVLVVTPGALTSSMVQKELRLARQEGVEISPVKGEKSLRLDAVPRWLGHVYDLDHPEELKKLLHVLEGPSQQQRVPMMAPNPPDDFVERAREYDHLKSRLLDPKGDAIAITAALRGAGGYGKTAVGRSQDAPRRAKEGRTEALRA
jgi:hypothetical protein